MAEKITLTQQQRAAFLAAKQPPPPDTASARRVAKADAAKKIQQENDNRYNKIGDNVDIVKLGNGKFTIDLTTAKGLEKVIGKVSRFVINLQLATDNVLYGKFELQDGDSKGIRQGIKKILDRGVLDAITKFAGVDFCKIFTYVLDQIAIPGVEKFDPNKPPVNPTPFEKKKWNMQKKAYDLQEKIDNFQAAFGGISNQAAIKEVVTQTLITFDELLGPNALGDPEFKDAFPETSLVTNYFEDIKRQLRGTVDRVLPNEEIEILFSYLSGIKSFLIVIQSFNDPKQLLSFANKITGGVIDQEIQDFNELLNPDKFAQLINTILQGAEKLNFYGKKVANYINLASTLVRLILLLVKVMRVLIASIRTISLLIPMIFSTGGVPFQLSDVYQNALKSEGFDKLIRRLNQINQTLLLMVAYITSLVFAMGEIIRKLTLIQANLQACTRKPTELLNNIDNTINNLKETRDELQDFLDRVNKADEAQKKVFGDYTIQIVNEELADENISVKRRYGIAVDNKGVAVVQSLPTFASLDEIIIQEVKLLLLSKNLVKSNPSDLSANDVEVITQSMKFLGDNEQLVMDLDQPILEDNEQDNDIEEFTSNLPGGRALRIKTRKKLIKENEKIKKDLQATDPQGKYSKSIITKKEDQNIKLRIANLKDEKKGIEIKIAALAVTVGGAFFIPSLVKRLREINDELDKLNPPKKLVSTNNTTAQG